MTIAARPAIGIAIDGQPSGDTGTDFMDRITTSILDAFSKDHGIGRLDEDTRFEHLTAYLAIRRHFGRTLDTGAVIVGDGGDTGLDAIAIILNGALITDVDQVQEMLDQNGYLEAMFVFVQAERTAGFDGAKIGTVGNGVLDFFAEEPKMDRNEKVSDAAEIMSAIYDRSASFRRRPVCRIYYVTTGKWTDDKNLVARRDAVVSDLKGTEMFDEVSFVPYGADDVHKFYQASKNAIAREFQFEKKIEIPKIPGVDLSFLGYISAKDFVSIIGDDAGDDIIGSIFYDNVRDWQDYNPVNSGMRDTLTSDKRQRFVLMNNGVTIITKVLKQAGSTFTIEDFQVVNGCQTSHVVFDQRGNPNEDVMIPLRLIATKDEDVIESIVLATNKQTALKPEQLYALTEFSKKLEAHFASFQEDVRLYYERRDGQYDNVAIAKNLIVAPKVAIRAFTAMFLAEPHTATKNYKSLQDRVGTDIFGPDHKLDMYYLAAYAAYRLEQEYNSGRIKSIYKSARYHLLLAIRLLMDPYPLSFMNSKDMEKRCQAMMPMLWDAAKASELFRYAKDVIDKVSGGKLDRDTIRTQTITQAIVKELSKAKT